MLTSLVCYPQAVAWIQARDSANIKKHWRHVKDSNGREDYKTPWIVFALTWTGCSCKLSQAGAGDAAKYPLHIRKHTGPVGGSKTSSASQQPTWSQTLHGHIKKWRHRHPSRVSMQAQLGHGQPHSQAPILLHLTSWVLTFICTSKILDAFDPFLWSIFNLPNEN